MLEQILSHNKEFVKKRKEEGENVIISGHAQKEVMIFTCMDTRLVELVEQAMGFKRGEVKVIKNAGNTIREGCDDVIRCISLGTLMMGIKEVYVVGHKDCGMKKLKPEDIKVAMEQRGISQDAIDAVDIKKWSGIIKDERVNIICTVECLRNSKYIPDDVIINGLIIDPYSGEIEVIA